MPKTLNFSSLLFSVPHQVTTSPPILLDESSPIFPSFLYLLSLFWIILLLSYLGHSRPSLILSSSLLLVSSSLVLVSSFQVLSSTVSLTGWEFWCLILHVQESPILSSEPRASSPLVSPPMGLTLNDSQSSTSSLSTWLSSLQTYFSVPLLFLHSTNTSLRRQSE